MKNDVERTRHWHRTVKEYRGLTDHRWPTLDSFIDAVGLKANSNWYLARRDRNKPHSTLNSFWSKELETETIYRSKRGVWNVYIYLEIDTLPREKTPRHRTVSIGTSATQEEALALYKIAKEIKDEREWHDWSPAEWRLAVAKRGEIK